MQHINLNSKRRMMLCMTAARIFHSIECEYSYGEFSVNVFRRSGEFAYIDAARMLCGIVEALCIGMIDENLYWKCRRVATEWLSGDYHVDCDIDKKFEKMLFNFAEFRAELKPGGRPWGHFIPDNTSKRRIAEIAVKLDEVREKVCAFRQVYFSLKAYCPIGFSDIATKAKSLVCKQDLEDNPSALNSEDATRQLRALGFVA